MGSRLSLFAISGAVVVVAACASGGPTPSITSVDPASHPFGAAPATRVVRIDGTGFAQRLIPDAGDPGGSTLQNPTVTIGGQIAALASFGEMSLTVRVPETLIDPSFYAVRVENPDGAHAAVEQGYRIVGTPTTLRVVSVTEQGDGSLNEVTMPVVVLDQGGAPIPMDVPLTGTAIANSSGTITGGGAFSIATGNTAGTLQVTDVRAETVFVTLDAVNPALAVEPGLATFIPGPAARVRVLAATSATPDVVTTVRIEDANGNVPAAHSDYSGTAFFTGACSANASVIPDPVIIPANAGSTTVTVTCATAPSSVRLGLSDGAGVLVSTSGLLVWQ